MTLTETFEISSNGEVRRDLEMPPIIESGSARLVEMLSDPDADLGEAGRLIALEMMKLLDSIQNPSANPLRQHTAREASDLIKSYREIQRTLNEAETAKKKDSLNLDGPKFEFVFTKIVGFFKQALKDAGVDDSLAENALLQFGDLIKQNADGLQKELNKI